MILMERITLERIEGHLLRLGGQNHSDNMERLRRFECHYSASLEERDFLGLVFLQNKELLGITPPGADRTLSAVAKRSLNLGQPRLGANWDLAENLRRTCEEHRKGSLFQHALVVCEARDGEECYGSWYLQDGSHRALGCATLMLLNAVQYERQLVYCSMSEEMYREVVRSAILDQRD